MKVRQCCCCCCIFFKVFYSCVLFYHSYLCFAVLNVAVLVITGRTVNKEKEKKDKPPSA